MEEKKEPPRFTEILMWVLVIIVSIGLFIAIIFFIIMAAHDSSNDPTVIASMVGHVSNKPNQSKLKPGRYIAFPSNTTRLTHEIHYLGTRNHVRYGTVKGYIIARNHTSNSGSKKRDIPQNTATESNTLSWIPDVCSNILSPGSRWKTPASYVLDTTNDRGLSDSFVVDMINGSMYQWNQVLIGFDIFGSRDTTHNGDNIDLNNPDGLNEIIWAHLNSDTTIAYTTVWGIFDGPVQSREIIEADIVFNEDFTWGDAEISGTTVMDGKNEATHELGHFSGMAHSNPITQCQDDTMWAYSDYGETKKRTPSIYDMEGLCALYDEYQCIVVGESSATVSPVPNDPSSMTNSLKFSSLLTCVVLYTLFILPI